MNITEEDIENFPVIQNTSNLNIEQIITILKNIYDPEISYSIYDLGLIYGIDVTINTIHIIMTLTTANCPEAQSLPQNVQDTLSEAFPDYQVNVEVTFEPLWTIDNMRDEVKLGLGLL